MESRTEVVYSTSSGDNVDKRRGKLAATLLPLDSARAEWLTGLCFLLVGLSSWIAINGIFQELIVMAPHVPEQYDIFNYAALLVSVSNVIPAAYVFALSRVPANQRAKIDRSAILVMVGGVGTASCLLIAGFWHHTSWLAGKQRSVALFVLIFLAGGVDSLTSVLFYPMVGRYRSRIALPSLNVGESLTGLVAALLATAQVGGGGSTYNPNFSVAVFLISLGVLMLISMAAFLALECGSWAKKEKEVADEETTIVSVSHHRGRFCPEMHLAMKVLLAQAMFSFLENGVHVSMVSHSLKQFPDADDSIALALKISFGGGAVFALLATKWHIAWDSRKLWAIIVSLCLACSAWILVASSVELEPTFFSPFTIIVAIVLKWAVVYGKTCVFISMPIAADLYSSSYSTSSQPPPTLPYDAYRWGGAGMQIGGVTGSLLFFLLTVQWDVFRF